MTSFHRADWLSFAQAITSTLAVVGAFAVIFVQHWLQRRRHRADAIRLLDFACSFVDSAYDHAKMFQSKVSSETHDHMIDFKRMKLVMTQLLRDLDSVPVLNLPTVLSARIFGMAKDQVERIIELIDSESNHRSPASYITFPTLVSTLSDVRDRLRAERIRIDKGGR